MTADLAFEKAYWGDCCNTFDEEQKHYVYAELMGIERIGYGFAAPPGPVLDIGGGPVSMLLKTPRCSTGVHLVVDPIQYPAWTQERYKAQGIAFLTTTGESLDWLEENSFAEAWIYNCLQHVEDPELIIRNARRAAPVLRLFEWVDIPPHEGHPQMLTAAALDEWTGGKGQVVELARSGCHGRGYGVVVGAHLTAGEAVPAVA